MCKMAGLIFLAAIYIILMLALINLFYWRVYRNYHTAHKYRKLKKIVRIIYAPYICTYTKIYGSVLNIAFVYIYNGSKRNLYSKRTFYIILKRILRSYEFVP